MVVVGPVRRRSRLSSTLQRPPSAWQKYDDLTRTHGQLRSYGFLEALRGTYFSDISTFQRFRCFSGWPNWAEFGPMTMCCPHFAQLRQTRANICRRLAQFSPTRLKLGNAGQIWQNVAEICQIGSAWCQAQLNSGRVWASSALDERSHGQTGLVVLSEAPRAKARRFQRCSVARVSFRCGSQRPPIFRFC